MSWTFEKVAGPVKGAAVGLAWDGSAMLFAAVEESRLLRFDPAKGSVQEVRRFTNRTSGLGLGPHGRLFGCQEGSRRIVEFNADGSATALGTTVGGRRHNFPGDLVVDRGQRIWFADRGSPMRS